MINFLKLFFEQWKDVVGYEGHYQISNFGKLRSVDRIVVNSNGIKRQLKGSVKNSFISGGYRLVTLSLNGKNKTYSIHRLVAEAFIPNPYSLTEVNHKSRNKLNNSIYNLEWCTSRENTHHARKMMKSSSKYVGVSFDKQNLRKPWISRITVNGRTEFLGRYKTEDLAYDAYKNECIKRNIKINSL